MGTEAVYNDGLVLHDSWPGCASRIAELGLFALTIADPPYGNILPAAWDKTSASEQIEALRAVAQVSCVGSACYWWGTHGKPKDRPFFELMARLEFETPWQIAALITWSKKRAYGVQHNYLLTREECAYLTLGDIKKPRTFHVPYLDEKRGYAGYNPKYPAHDERLRRTMVWRDITEIFKGKLHAAHKPGTLFKIMIETHTEPGEPVLDLYSGSGQCAVTARELGRSFVSVENDPNTFVKILERLGNPLCLIEY